MGLKRKRSSPTVSSPSTTASDATADSPGPIWSYYQQQKPTPALYEKPTWSFPTYDDSPSTQHLNSRTRKRHRDNRPDEEDVYASTITKLFDAQRRLPGAPSDPPAESFASTSIPSKPQKSTLHSFWTLPTSRSDAMDMDHDNGGNASMNGVRCEDCDSLLRDDSAMVMDDSTNEQETACAACRRYVCDMCAVRGHERLCLACASGR